MYAIVYEIYCRFKKNINNLFIYINYSFGRDPFQDTITSAHQLQHPSNPSRPSYQQQLVMYTTGMKLETFPQAICCHKMILWTWSSSQGFLCLVDGKLVTILVTMFPPTSTSTILVSGIVMIFFVDACLICSFVWFHKISLFVNSCCRQFQRRGVGILEPKIQ